MLETLRKQQAQWKEVEAAAEALASLSTLPVLSMVKNSKAEKQKISRSLWAKVV